MRPMGHRLDQKTGRFSDMASETGKARSANHLGAGCLWLHERQCERKAKARQGCVPVAWGIPKLPDTMAPTAPSMSWGRSRRGAREIRRGWREHSQRVSERRMQQEWARMNEGIDQLM